MGLMDEIKNDALEVLAESIDLEKLASGLATKVVSKALDKVVADSENTFDDMAKAALWPVLEKEVNELIEKHLDLRKILGLDDEDAGSEVVTD